jgi:glutamate carboxypeptidase
MHDTPAHHPTTLTTPSVTPRHQALLDSLRAQRDAMVELLAELVAEESPSSEPAATRRCAEIVAAACQRMLGAEAELVDISGRAHLLLRGAGPQRVLLLGHVDTVWPTGTLARWPFRVDGDNATGPGSFDMKAGIVQGLFAMAALNDLDGVALLLTSDEEIGSPTSRQLVEDCARASKAVLVLEPSQDGAVKVARKGVGQYRIEVHGRAAHAGLEPERGINALVGLAGVVRTIASLGDAGSGTTVTPTTAHAGTASNVVPAEAVVDVDVRTATDDESVRVDTAMHALRCDLDGATVRVIGGPNRPPMPTSSSARLHELARRLSGELGLGELPGAHVGGGSDGNFTAGVGTPTLDGLGAVGAGAHAEGEHVLIPAMPDRATLLAALIDELRSEG